MSRRKQAKPQHLKSDEELPPQDGASEHGEGRGPRGAHPGWDARAVGAAARVPDSEKVGPLPLAGAGGESGQPGLVLRRSARARRRVAEPSKLGRAARSGGAAVRRLEDGSESAGPEAEGRSRGAAGRGVCAAASATLRLSAPAQRSGGPGGSRARRDPALARG